MKSQLDQAYRRAERPVKGRVSANAHAVLFRDQGELLACLCRDALDGTLTGKWWWKQSQGALFSSLPRSTAIRSSLLSAPQEIPAVFEQLARWRLAIPLIELFDDTDADALTRAFLVEFSCSRLMQKLVEPTRSGDDVGDTETVSGDTAERSPTFRSWFADDSDRRFLRERNVHHIVAGSAKSAGTSKQTAYPPWLTLFSDQVWESRLTRSQACLLGLARTAFTNAALLRNTAFENQVVIWWSDAQSTYPPGAEADNTPPFQTSSADFDHTPSSDAAASALIHPLMAQASTGDKKLSTVDSGLGKAGDNRIYNASSNLVERSRPSDSDSAWGDILVDSVSDLESGTPWSASEDVRKPPARETSAGLEPLHVEGNDSSDNAADDSFSHLDAQANAEVGNWDDTEEATEEALDEGVDELRPNWLTDNFVDTELGGLLYLINLLEQLELPEAMDVDWHFDARLGRWGFLELIALGLLNESLEGLKDDPLWHLLAKLSGRKPGSPIGERYLSDFVPDFRLPPDWWKHLISAVDRSVHLWWAVQADRMRIWCDECVLVDHAVGSDGPPHPDGLLASVQAELRPYQQGGEALPIGSGPFDRAPWERPSDALVRAAGAPLCRWVSMAMPFLRWFLQRQLHLDSATGDRLMETLLGLPARIYFTPSHVDMVADVNLTSLAIRRSGLDQDPGWQPLYGRVLLFHFAQV
ncbi:MAG: hypothetical protein N838_07160 [Thiohalocapsa sp. PB-PSB1]|nr:MAG: hypothetical protein N838_07160 [Thiohalocapsa sp. PB-PSB1]